MVHRMKTGRRLHHLECWDAMSAFFRLLGMSAFVSLIFTMISWLQSPHLVLLQPLNYTVLVQYLCWSLFKQQTSSVPYLQLEMLQIMFSTSQFQFTLPFASFLFAEGSWQNNHRNSTGSSADVCGTVFTDYFVAMTVRLLNRNEELCWHMLQCSTHFTNVLFAVLRISMAWSFSYCKYKSATVEASNFFPRPFSLPRATTVVVGCFASSTCSNHVPS
jgi:hypothetical protein